MLSEPNVASPGVQPRWEGIMNDELRMTFREVLKVCSSRSEVLLREGCSVHEKVNAYGDILEAIAKGYSALHLSE